MKEIKNTDFYDYFSIKVNKEKLIYTKNIL